ncbi:MAG: hypothetical protein O2923_11560 [Verrucomicrobia bacterium]|nr:hypothetical protein [Verrucomicrobiota bacterium]MDA1085918.1 hypothetical protein [Verrucomicrobiota bacterium]
MQRFGNSHEAGSPAVVGVMIGLLALGCLQAATGEDAGVPAGAADELGLGPLEEVEFWESRHKELELEIVKRGQERKKSRADLMKQRENVVKLQREAMTSDEEIKKLHSQVETLKRRVKEAEAELQQKLNEIPGIREGTEGQTTGARHTRDLDAQWRELYVEKRTVWEKLVAAKKRAADAKKASEVAGAQ